jgi:hypothetical protein
MGQANVLGTKLRQCVLLLTLFEVFLGYCEGTPVCDIKHTTWHQMIDELGRIRYKADVVWSRHSLSRNWQKATKSLSQDDLQPGRISKHALHEYKSRALHHTNLLGARTHLPLPFIHNQDLLSIREVGGPETSYYEVLRGFPQYL